MTFRINDVTSFAIVHLPETTCPPGTMEDNSVNDVITITDVIHSVTCHCSVRARPFSHDAGAFDSLDLVMFTGSARSRITGAPSWYAGDVVNVYIYEPCDTVTYNNVK
jgi:hypothetical protein